MRCHGLLPWHFTFAAKDKDKPLIRADTYESSRIIPKLRSSKSATDSKFLDNDLQRRLIASQLDPRKSRHSFKGIKTQSLATRSSSVRNKNCFRKIQ